MIKTRPLKTVSVFLALLLLLTLVGCTDDSTSQCDRSTETPATMEIEILHAGGAYGELTLLNAQEPFEYYYALGYRYFEYDLRLSSDGRLIGTHGFEHLPITDASLSYEAFTALELENGMTPVNEEWLIDTIRTHPDVRIIVDAKMDTREDDVAVLRRLEELENIAGLDLSANIIPEIFSIEMWIDAEASTSFDCYIFSHYKEYYSVDTILEHFSSPKILYVAVPTWTDSYIQANLYKVQDAGKHLLVFTVTNQDERAFAQDIGASGIYVDYPTLTEAENLSSSPTNYIEP